MHLKSVEINNFRPFYGNNIFKFNSENINLISGKNGSGKSAFIDAIYWCLYGLEIFGECSQHICNNEALNQADVDEDVIVHVICTFVEDNNAFKVRREIHFTKNDDLNINRFSINSKWEVLRSNHLGEHEFIEPVLFIKKHIPMSLFSLLFFDEEYINSFFEANSITNIKDIMFKFSEKEVIHKANLHLNKLLDQYIEELKFKDREFNLNLKRQDELKKELTEIEYKIDNFSREYQNLDSEKFELKKNLMDSSFVVESYDIKDVLRDRDNLLRIRESLEDRVVELKKVELKLIFKQFPIALSLSTISKEFNNNDLENMLLKNEDFKNTRFYDGCSNIETLFQKLSIKKFNKVSEEIHYLHNKLENTFEQLEELNSIIQNIDDSELRKLLAILKDIESLQVHLNYKLDHLNYRKKSLSKELSKIHRKIERFNNSRIQSVDDNKIKFCNSAREFGELLMEQFDKNFLYEFSDIINYIFIDAFEMNNKFKRVNIDENHDISLINMHNQKISINDLSFSEKKLLKLSLMFSIYYCLELECPIILMDPFNNLDIEKTNKVLSIILNNQFNNQILLIMNENQYNGSIQDTLFKNKVIKYNLKNHNGNTEVLYYG